MTMLKKLVSSSMFLPLCALAVLLLFNIIFVDDFLSIQMANGHLYGRIIDILCRSSSLTILSLGMTFVIATSGIDISVVAVVAISAAVCCMIIGGRGDGVPEMASNASFAPQANAATRPIVPPSTATPTTSMATSPESPR